MRVASVHSAAEVSHPAWARIHPRIPTAIRDWTTVALVASMVGMTGIDRYWFAAFTLAWEAFQERSIPVGAVLVDGSGTVIGRGRNRMSGTTAPVGQIAGSRIAHAEINALAQLPSDVHEGPILYTTLEPCFLCTMALRFSHVSTVHYAAPDATWYGVDQLQQVNHHVARRWTRRDGPLGGWWQEFSLLLNHISAIERDAVAVLSTPQARPTTIELARRLATGSADRLRNGSLQEVINELRPQLYP
jgi:tRNA(adenine34) deaminase